ncbi:MAG: hypothetical protein ABW046_22635 [Actinoplanes sp.]
MKWIYSSLGGLLAGVGAVLLLGHMWSPPTSRPEATPVRVEVSATGSAAAGGAPDTLAAERAGCEALRALGVTAQIGDWVTIATTLNGTRLGREAAEVRRQAATGSRSATYGAVLDVLEGCLALGV